MMRNKLIWKFNLPVQTKKRTQKALTNKTMTINKTYKQRITKSKVARNPTREALLA